MAHAERYARAREFHQVVTGLWNSWDPDALTGDKSGELPYDPARLHKLNHRGAHFAVAGLLNVVRSPQTQDGQRSRQQLLTDLAQGEPLTIRQLYERLAGGRGHFTVAGTARRVADQMQEWFAGRGGRLQFHGAGAARWFR
ncbi:hypothetical protein [Duganella callida]|uniref:hypothetical protein n=1 Tax=Duganella callida TaxID=2561932 RepID=UPI0035314652